MENLIPVNYDVEQPTVSARELYKKLNIGTKFTTWFERMKAYGFSEGNEFFPEVGETSEQGGRPATDYQISIDMAKQICMIQRTPEGKLIRQYFIDLEKAWNTPPFTKKGEHKMSEKENKGTLPEEKTEVVSDEKLKDVAGGILFSAEDIHRPMPGSKEDNK